jgi:hypothetical protein
MTTGLASELTLMASMNILQNTAVESLLMLVDTDPPHIQRLGVFLRKFLDFHLRDILLPATHLTLFSPLLGFCPGFISVMLHRLC